MVLERWSRRLYVHKMIRNVSPKTVSAHQTAYRARVNSGSTSHAPANADSPASSSTPSATTVRSPPHSPQRSSAPSSPCSPPASQNPTNHCDAPSPCQPSPTGSSSRSPTAAAAPSRVVHSHEPTPTNANPVGHTRSRRVTTRLWPGSQSMVSSQHCHSHLRRSCRAPGSDQRRLDQGFALYRRIVGRADLRSLPHLRRRQ